MTTVLNGKDRILTPKQMQFVRAYLIDPNATRAAIAAGYSAKAAGVQGARLLANAKVLAQVTTGQEKQAERNGLTEDEVITGLRHEATLTGEGSSHSARVAAWSALGKHLGMFSEKQEQQHTGTVTIRIIRDEPTGAGDY